MKTPPSSKETPDTHQIIERNIVVDLRELTLGNEATMDVPSLKKDIRQAVLKGRIEELKAFNIYQCIGLCMECRFNEQHKLNRVAVLESQLEEGGQS